VYTFGPTFRAENSNTSRHLAEFWMIEPEIAFADLEDDMNLAEAYVKFCTQYALDNCKEDLAFFDKMIEKGLIDRLTNVVEAPFQRLTYTEAIEVLLQPKHLKKGKFQVKPYWGLDLGSEHERYLCEQVYKRPTILTDYPKEIKAFYMRLSDDEKTVQVPFGCRQRTTRVPITPLRACCSLSHTHRSNCLVSVRWPPWISSCRRLASWWAAVSARNALMCWSAASGRSDRCAADPAYRHHP
jgi:hypothetical protein